MEIACSLGDAKWGDTSTEPRDLLYSVLPRLTAVKNTLKICQKGLSYF